MPVKPKDDVDIATLKELFEYDEDAGSLVWRKPRTWRAKPGARAGWVEKHGHIAVRIDGRTYKAHRIVFAIVHGRWPNGSIDHRDGDPQNNHISNLRECTHAQNVHNSCIARNNTSGAKGVSWGSDRSAWVAQISVNGRNIRLGSFKTVAEASHAYQAAARRLRGEFVRPVITEP